MSDRPILLVEDNPDDELLTLRALKKNRILNEVLVAHDGVEALEYLFGTGPHAGRDLSVQPQIILLDLNLPRVDGMEVLRRIREDERTKLLSGGRSHIVERGGGHRPAATRRGRTATSGSRSSSRNSPKRCGCSGLFWLLLNEPAPVPSSGARRRP